MGYVKQAYIERVGLEHELAQALADADSAIEGLLKIGLLSDDDRHRYEGWQASILLMFGVMEEKSEPE